MTTRGTGKIFKRDDTVSWRSTADQPDKPPVDLPDLLPVESSGRNQEGSYAKLGDNQRSTSDNGFPFRCAYAST